MGLTNLHDFPVINDHRKDARKRKNTKLEYFINGLLDDGLINQNSSFDEVSQVLDTLQEIPSTKEKIIEYYQKHFSTEAQNAD